MNTDVIRQALDVGADNFEDPPDYVTLRDAVLEALAALDHLSDACAMQSPEHSAVDLREEAAFLWGLAQVLPHEGIEDAIDRMEERLRSTRGLLKEDWQPIETAPRDGTRYLGSCGGEPFVCYYDDEVYHKHISQFQTDIAPHLPKWWMPFDALPPPPQPVSYAEGENPR